VGVTWGKAKGKSGAGRWTKKITELKPQRLLLRGVKEKIMTGPVVRLKKSQETERGSD